VEGLLPGAICNNNCVVLADYHGNLLGLLCPEGRGLRLRKKPCRVWRADITALKLQDIWVS